MNRAALFFDIDGTVLSEITKEIPASTVDALKRAHDAGHFLFINTGRTYCSVPVELKKLPFDGYLCGCGIYFTFDEEIIFEKHLDPERGDEIADYMTKCQIDGIFEGAEDVYFTSRVSRFDRLENTKKYMNNRGLGIERYMEQRRCPYDKIFIYTDEKSDVKAFFEFIKDDMEVIDRGSNTFECILKGYTKGTAIDWVLEHFGMTRDQSYVFGDSSNDLAVIAVQTSKIKESTMNKIRVADLGDSSKIKVGEMAVAIGNALGYGQSVTVGYISAKDREIAYAMKKYGLID